MRFSVVTISFNQGRFLPACIESVLNQRDVEIEHIVVDAMSTDETPDVLRAYNRRLAHVLVEKDDGPADGLNKGFLLASGDIYFFLNADDVVLPGAFSRVSREFLERSGTQVIYGDGVVIDDVGRVVRPLWSSPLITPYSFLTGASVLVQQATYFVPDAFRSAGGFNKRNRTWWDGELVLEMARAGATFRHLPEYLGGFRVHETSITGSGRLTAEFREDQERKFRQTYGRKKNMFDMISGIALRSAFKLSKVNRRLRSTIPS